MDNKIIILELWVFSKFVFFRKTLEKSELFTYEDYKKLNLFYRLTGRVFRFFASLM